jgi:uncharacterized membrane protein (Fun14 family)
VTCFNYRSLIKVSPLCCLGVVTVYHHAIYTCTKSKTNKSYNIVFLQAIVGSLNMCAAKTKTFKIINEVSGTIRPSR